MDVHKATVVACVRMAEGGQIRSEVQSLATTMPGLLALSDWLTGHAVTHVAMEATGVYWKPVWHVLGEAFELVLANAAHIRNVPGRKRYQGATRAEKHRLLDEVVAVTGIHRKAAIRLLRPAPRARGAPGPGGRPRVYGPEVATGRSRPTRLPRPRGAGAFLGSKGTPSEPGSHGVYLAKRWY